MTTVKSDDAIVFADERGEVKEPACAVVKTWKVMIVDDDADIHEVTKLALSGSHFFDRNIEFISAMSGSEAKALVLEHQDLAIILLDVVMETDHAGLDVAKYVREVANNSSVRIILRTGEPGQAPERKVITEYDINDYKEKTELTAGKLFTLMYASLRSYRDIIALEQNKRGLERVIDASSTIFELQSMQNFTRGVLEQLTSLLHLERDAAIFKIDGLAAAHNENKFRILAGTGCFKEFIESHKAQVLNLDIPDADAQDLLPNGVIEDFKKAIAEKRNIFARNCFTGFFKSSRGGENLVHVRGMDGLSALDHALLEVFTNNVCVAFENIELNQDLEETQREIVYLLGEAVETRSQETGNHVKRVAEISKILALGIGLSEEEAELIHLASPMHDVGKIGISDEILNKPGRHTPEEMRVMKTHAILGYNMLKASKRRILQAGAIIARDHHEKWNGEGYPSGLKAEDIHVYGRIVAVADVFDALGSDRCYKKAWPLDEIVKLFYEQSGQHFDPRIVKVLMDKLDDIVAIRDALLD